MNRRRIKKRKQDRIEITIEKKPKEGKEERRLEERRGEKMREEKITRK